MSLQGSIKYLREQLNNNGDLRLINGTVLDPWEVEEGEEQQFNVLELMLGEIADDEMPESVRKHIAAGGEPDSFTFALYLAASFNADAMGEAIINMTEDEEERRIDIEKLQALGENATVFVTEKVISKTVEAYRAALSLES